MRGRSTLVALVPLALAACAHGDRARNQGPAFSRRDSTDVQITVTSGAAAHTPLGWEVDSVPDLSVGDESSPGQALARVQGVRELPDGRVLVVDGGSAELRVFDSEGRLVGRGGGFGKGPGEFINPALVPEVGTDSLLFFDMGTARLQLFSPTGEYQREIPGWRQWPMRDGKRPPLGALDSRLLLAIQGFVGGEASQSKDGIRQLSMVHAWFDPDSGGVTQLDSFVVDEGYQFQENHFTVGIPFASWPRAAVGKTRAFATDGRSPEIREYGVDGRLRRILRIDEKRRPVTKSIVAQIPVDNFRGWESRKLITAIPEPDSLPVFDALMVDDVGWLWAEVYGWDPAAPKEWIVFDPEGRARGSVDTPPGLELGQTLRGVELGEIGRDFILGLWRDAYDVEHVRRYALHRAGSPMQADR